VTLGVKLKMEYFLDTYALIEIAKSNPVFTRLAESKFFTLKLNLLELYYYFLQNGKPREGGEAFLVFSQYCGNVSDDVLKKAAKFRFEFISKHKRKQRISFIDAIGYVYAKEKGLKFVTGDDAFAKMENVEFLK